MPTRNTKYSYSGGRKHISDWLSSTSEWCKWLIKDEKHAKNEYLVTSHERKPSQLKPTFTQRVYPQTSSSYSFHFHHSLPFFPHWFWKSSPSPNNSDAHGGLNKIHINIKLFNFKFLHSPLWGIINLMFDQYDNLEIQEKEKPLGVKITIPQEK